MTRYPGLTIWLAILATCFVLSSANGQTTAKYAGEFLNLGAGARSLGMGNAFVAVATDVTASYWNPAGLAQLNYPQFMLMHSSQFSGVVNYDYGAAAVPVGERSSLGLTVFRLGVDNIKRTALRNPDLPLGDVYVDENGQLVRNTPFVSDLFGSSDYAFYLTYARRNSGRFSYGGNVKFVLRNLDKNSAWGLGFDLGFLFNPVQQLVVGVNLQDLTTTLLAWDTGRRELITPTLRAGATYPIEISAAGGHVRPALDFVFRFEERQESALANVGPMSLDLNFGVEYAYRNAVAVRVGASEMGEFTAGAGLHLPKLHVDYAFLQHDTLGGTHRISARLTLEQPKFQRKRSE